MKKALFFANGPDLWLEIFVVLLCVIGAILSLMAAIGLLRLTGFYSRLHMPSLVTVGGCSCLSFAYMIVHKFTLGIFPYRALTLLVIMAGVGPLTLMMISRGMLYREIFSDIQGTGKSQRAKWFRKTIFLFRKRKKRKDFSPPNER